MLGGMNNEEVEMATTLINTTGNQRDGGNVMRSGELDPAILDEFKKLDAKAKEPNFNSKGERRHEFDFNEAEEKRYLELIDMVAQRQVERFGGLSKEKTDLWQRNI